MKYVSSAFKTMRIKRSRPVKTLLVLGPVFPPDGGIVSLTRLAMSTVFLTICFHGWNLFLLAAAEHRFTEMNPETTRQGNQLL